MWKTFEKFRSELQGEAVDNVIQGRANMHTINAKDISFQVKTHSITC